ncbi:MAG: S8 family serine peptidase [Actinomycetales bacterium]
MRTHRAATAALACAGLAVLALSGPAAQAQPATPQPAFSLAAEQPVVASREPAAKGSLVSMAQTPQSLRENTDPALIPVLIKYDYEAAASYRGSVRGYTATSPSVTGKALDRAAGDPARYLAMVGQREQQISQRVRAAVPRAQITQSYDVVYGGVAAMVPGNSIRTLLATEGVVAVQPDAVNQPLTDASPEFIKATEAYSQLETTGKAGAGLVLANLDTGLWPEHPAFADPGDLPQYTGPELRCDYGDNPLTDAVDPFRCNDKIVGGYSFLATYDNAGLTYTYPRTARDSEGHGSHTASTSAGSIVRDVQTLGPTLARIQGIAPGAQIIEYRVCGPSGCYNSDTMSAVQQAVLDGVDVLNYSISGGTSPTSDPTELAFLDAYNAGIFVAASAGNEGPGAGTANHAAPWVTTVGASTQAREFTSRLSLRAGNGSTYEVSGASITQGAGPAPVVLATAVGLDALCTTPAAQDSLIGKIVVCERGEIARVEKGANVAAGGAAGMILYNPGLADVETDNHWLPTVHVADGTALVAFMTSNGEVTGSFTDAERSLNGHADVMASFSSRGPLGPVIKPDITAPGVQILAAMTPTPDEVVGGPPGQYYQAIAGTSMSAPHVAGAALLIRALHPDWTPGQIKSAMMTQAVGGVLKEDEVTPADPFDQGAGRLDVARALDAPLTISEDAETFAALINDPAQVTDLNLPSINAAVMPGRLTTTRTVRNVTDRTLRVTVSADLAADSSLVASPSRFSIAPGQERTISLTLRSRAPIGEQQFGAVRLVTSAGTVRLPVAFVRQQGNVTLAQTCESTDLVVGSDTTCEVTAINESLEPRQVSVTTGTAGTVSITSADGARLTDGRAFTRVTLPGATAGVPSVATGTTPAGGFLDLAEFNVQPLSIGDEEILNADVAPFTYNGAQYTRIGVDSNGYLVVGGGTSADNQCCLLPSGPSPDAPNNILAPLWTDLDGSRAPGVSLATLTGGGSSWIVAQWQVHVYGTDDLRQFQVWIGTGTTADISFGYSEPQSDPNGQLFLVGAENEAGAGDVSATLPESSLVVSSTEPTAGGSKTFTVTVHADATRWGALHSEMAAEGVPGKTIVDTPITVRP